MEDPETEYDSRALRVELYERSERIAYAHYDYRASAEMDVIMDSCVDLGYGTGCVTRMLSFAKYSEHGPEYDSVMGFLDGWAVVTDYWAMRLLAPRRRGRHAMGVLLGSGAMRPIAASRHAARQIRLK